MVVGCALERWWWRGREKDDVAWSVVPGAARNTGTSVRHTA
jgi:hypothetical protein